MTIDDLLAPADVLVGLRAAGKPALLDTLARRAADSLGLVPGDVLAALSRREELGSTGVGEGVALPHARLEAIRDPFGLFARLREPIDFGSVDDQPVDLVFLLLLPAGPHADHLNALATVARRLRDKDGAAAMRKARDAAALHAVMREGG